MECGTRAEFPIYSSSHFHLPTPAPPVQTSHAFQRLPSSPFFPCAGPTTAKPVPPPLLQVKWEEEKRRRTCLRKNWPDGGGGEEKKQVGSVRSGAVVCFPLPAAKLMQPHNNGGKSGGRRPQLDSIQSSVGAVVEELPQLPSRQMRFSRFASHK